MKKLMYLLLIFLLALVPIRYAYSIAAGFGSAATAGFGQPLTTGFAGNSGILGPGAPMSTMVNPAATDTAESQRALDQRLREDFPASNSAAYPNGAIPNPASPYLSYPNAAIPNPSYPAAEYPYSTYPNNAPNARGSPTNAVPERW